VVYDCSLITVPQDEEALAEYDWENFPPRRQDNGRGSFSIIDECTGIEGKLITRQAFIHGQLQGLVFAENVVVERTGRINGVILCRTLTIFGSVKANIVCDHILVRSGGLLSANLKYRSLKVEPGGSVGGKFQRRTLVDAAPVAPAGMPVPANNGRFIRRG